jgi:RES domain-containing protein
VIPRLPLRRDGALHAWRLDRARHAASWDSGEGAFRAGGRWNGKGVRAVYCAFDPATAILEVAVHKGFRVLDTEPHVLTALRLRDEAALHVVAPDDEPNPNWLVPGIPSAGQQEFGDALLTRHGMIAVPSVVSRHSWNLVFDAARVAGRYARHGQERFALDPRLHAPGK